MIYKNNETGDLFMLFKTVKDETIINTSENYECVMYHSVDYDRKILIMKKEQFYKDFSQVD